MKKLAYASTAALLALASPLAQAAPALVINPAGACGLFDGNAVIVVTNDTKVVATQSDNNNAMLQCKATVAPSASGVAVRYDFNSTGGILCGMFTAFGLRLTDQWHETVSANGQAMLICHNRE